MRYKIVTAQSCLIFTHGPFWSHVDDPCAIHWWYLETSQKQINLVCHMTQRFYDKKIRSKITNWDSQKVGQVVNRFSQFSEQPTIKSIDARQEVEIFSEILTSLLNYLGQIITLIFC